MTNTSSLSISDSELSIGLNETYGSAFLSYIDSNIATYTLSFENLTMNIKGVSDGGVATGTTYTLNTETAKWSKN